MGRKWIGVELGEHAYTLCKVRSNLWYDEISDKYGNRVYSRIIGNYTPLEFAGRDVRQLKN